MEKKKNKTDKERLVASTDVQDTPAFGLKERPLHLSSQLLLPRWSQEGLSYPFYSGGSGQCGAMPSSHENRQQRSLELERQNRSCCEITQPAQPTVGSFDPIVNTPLLSPPWALGLRIGPCTFRAHSCLSSLWL